MDEREFHDLVIRIDQNLANLVDAFDKASGPDGFARCGVRAEQIKTMQESIQNHKGSHTWQNRSIGMVLIAALINLLITLATRA